MIDKEDPGKVKQDVTAFRKDFQKVHYCFPSARTAYEYITIH
jgi:glycine hydroxymethyltransferase